MGKVKLKDRLRKIWLEIIGEHECPNCKTRLAFFSSNDGYYCPKCKGYLGELWESEK